MNILYSSAVEIGSPTGPGVNELEFLIGLKEKCSLEGIKLIGYINAASLVKENVFHDVYEFQKTNLTHPLPGMSPVIKLRHYENKFLQFLNYLNHVETKIDLIILRLDNNFNIGFGEICQQFNIKYHIKSLHNEYGLRQSSMSWKKRLLATFIFRPRLSNTINHSIYVDSPQPQFVDFYKEKFPSANVRLITNGTDAGKFQRNESVRSQVRKSLGIDEKTKVIGYCGGMPSERGVHQLVSIAKSLHCLIPDLVFLIVGNSKHQGRDDVKELKSYAISLEVNHLFHFTDFVPYEDVPEYIQAMDIGIALDTAEKVKTYGNSSQKIFQYIASGIPVIFPEGTNKFIDNKYGMGVHVEDLGGFQDAIIELLQRDVDPSIANNYIDKNFSVCKTIDERFKLWKSLNILQTA